MTEQTPADQEIAELRVRYGVTSSGRGIKEFTQVADFARAVLAKWGQPQAVAGKDHPQFLGYVRDDGVFSHSPFERRPGDIWVEVFTAPPPQAVRDPQCSECDGTGTVAASQAHFKCPVCTPTTTKQQPMTEQRQIELYAHVQREVAKLEDEGRYTFAGWFPVAVRAIEAAHGITKGGHHG